MSLRRKISWSTAMRDLQQDRAVRNAPASTLRKLRRTAEQCGRSFLHAGPVDEFYDADIIAELVAAGSLIRVEDRYEFGRVA